MFCVKCGTSMAPGSRYCVSCGYDMQEQQNDKVTVEKNDFGNSSALTNISKALTNIVKIGNANGKKGKLRVSYIMSVVITIFIFLLMIQTPLFGFDKSADGRFDADVNYTAGVFYSDLDDNEDEQDIYNVSCVFFVFVITSAIAVSLFKYAKRSEWACLFAVIGFITLLIYRGVIGAMWEDFHSDGVTLSLAPFIFCILAFIALIIVSFIGIVSENTTES